MAERGKNLVSLFVNAKTRMIIVFTAIVVLIAVLVGVIKLTRSNSELGGESAASVSGVPGISSVPGSINPTEQYAKLQAQQNINKVKIAEQTGASAIPTLIHTEKFGEGKTLLGESVSGGVGFSGLALAKEGGSKKPWLYNLELSKCGNNEVTAARQNGATVKELLSACNCLQLKAQGFELNELKNDCPCQQLKTAGYSAKELRNVGFTATQLRACGYSACEMKAAGFSARELLEAGYSEGELKGAGFSDAEIKSSSGVPENITPDDIRKAGCGAAELAKLRSQGVSASAIRRISGCSAAQLKAAGYTAAELKDAGFSAAELREAGFSAAELRAAGFSAKELKDAGFSAEELKHAGFSDNEIEEAFKSINKTNQCSPEALKKARAEGMTAKKIRESFGCSASEMKAAGFTAKELREAGFSAKELRDAGFTAKELRDAGFSAKELRDAGFTAAELKAAGFSARELKEAGFSAKELKDAGFSANELKDAGFSARQLMEVGFSAKELKDAGFSPEALKAAGFSAEELLAAGFNKNQLKAAGFTDKDLGYSPSPEKEITKQSTAPKSSLNERQSVDDVSKLITDPKVRDALMEQKAKQARDRVQQRIQKIQSQMRSEAQKIMAEWKVPEQATVQGENQDVLGKGGVKSLLGPNAGGEQNDNNDGPSMIKAGDIQFAVLETNINSDEQSPILAQIVQGRFKGSKLIGTLSLPANGQRVILRFNAMSIPGAPKTIAVDAVAIDLNTARTALSSKTDNHYLSRYGSLLASAFLEGFGSSIATSGTQIQVSGFNVSSTEAKKSLGENALAALGKVGQAWGNAAARNINQPPTVHVYSGVGLGILFMKDVPPLE